MFSHCRGSALGESGCLRDSDTPVCRAGGPAVSAVRQRSGVPGRRRAGVVTAAGGVQPLYLESGSPWENGYIESFNGKLRDELLNGEIFDTLVEA